MVGVAQLVEHGIVTPVVVGSIPIVHPIFRKGARFNSLAPFLFYGLWFIAPGFRSKGRAFRRVCGLAACVSTTGHVRRIGRQGDGSQSLLYIEAVEAEPWRDGLYSSSGWNALLHSHL